MHPSSASMSSSEPGILSFQCNICGAYCQFQLDRLERETISCVECRSTPRVRAVVDIFARKLVGQSMPLPQFPDDHSLCGLGMTDLENYASRLAKKFNYQNTYLHREPRLDIAAEVSPTLWGSNDFVISSDVFEHVLPPVARAFDNVSRLLKPGGLFILTVPFGTQPKTIEHFPELHDFQIVETDGNYVLTNVTREGVVQRFDRLVFHGGPGTTLEMRVFAECDLIKHLAAAGFSEIEVHRNPLFQYGIWWAGPCSFPISARKPTNRS
jgi:SAM-dependent methyltransferase